MRLILLHLSDLHIYDDENIKKAGIYDIMGVLRKHSYDNSNEQLLIIFTGDITFSGRSEQYEIAIEYLTDLKEAISIEYPGLTISYSLVPGNHDCDFSVINEAAEIILDNLTWGKKINDDTLKLTMRKQDEYWNFHELIMDREYSCCERIISVESFSVDNNVVSVLALNSSWSSSLEEEMSSLKCLKSCIDEFFNSEDFQNHKAADLRISIMHHPLGWFNNLASSYLSEALEESSDIIMFGHEHESNYYVKSNYVDDANCYVFGSALAPHNSTASAFNLMTIDLHNMVEDFFIYHRNNSDENYTEIHNVKNRKLKKNRYTANKLKLNDDFTKHLNLLGCNVEHKHRGRLSLDDIHVLPDFELEIKGEQFVVIREDLFYDKIKTHKKILINGDKYYGKTVMSKHIFKYLLDEGQIPVLLSGENIKVGKKADIHEYVQSVLCNQYSSSCHELVMQTSKTRRAIIIDDFDKIQLSNSAFIELVEYIESNFDFIILLSTDDELLLTRVGNTEIFDRIYKSFEKLTILESGRYVLDKLVRRWLKHNEQEVQSQSVVEFDHLAKAYSKKIQSVQNENFFDKSIMSQLMLLSVLDSQNEEKYLTKYAHVYEPLIMMQINRAWENKSDEIAKVTAILEILAYKCFVQVNETSNSMFGEELVIDAVDEYYSEFGERISVSKLINKLIEAEILRKESDNSLAFYYSYINYYYVSKYMYQNSIEVDALLSDIYLERNASVILFLAYEYGTKNNVVLDKLIEKMRSCYSEHNEYDYEHINSFSDSEYILESISSEKNFIKNGGLDDIGAIDKNRKEHLKTSDDTERVRKELLKRNRLENDEEATSGINEAIKTLNIVGEILRNFSPKLRIAQKQKAINESMRLIQRISMYFSINLERGLALFYEAYKEKQEAEDGVSAESKILDEVRRHISMLWMRIMLSSTLRAARVIDSSNLMQFCENVMNIEQSKFKRIVRLVQVIDNMKGELPFKMIKDLLNDDDSTFQMKSIIRVIVRARLEINKYNYKDRKKVIDILRIDDENNATFIENAKRNKINS